MTKQIPLRLEDGSMEKLEAIKTYLGEKTANKAMVEMIDVFMPTVKELKKAREEIIQLNIMIGNIKQNYENMMHFKSELEELIK